MSATQTPDNAAVIPSLTCPDVPVEVWIEVDGKKVPYYDRGHNEIKKEVTCWIESEAGKPFSIRYKPTATENLSFMFYLDGTLTANYFYLPKHAQKTYSVSSIQVSNTEARNLVFGTLELTDDDDYLKQRSQLEKFGEIQVVVRRMTSLTQISNSEPAKYNTYSLPDTKVHERAKKGLTHMIKQGETKQQKASPCSHNGTYGPILAIFVFRYRPRAMLQANGVMPPDPSASSSSTQSTQDQTPSEEREVASEQESDHDNNIAEAEEEERALLARLEEVRQKRKLAEESRSSGSQRKKVKIERLAPKLNFAPGEAVDTAGDIRVVAPTPKPAKKKVVIDLTI